MAEDRSADLDGYTVSFVSIRQSHDLAPMLKSLPGGSRPCPHWGYVLKGPLIVRYDGAAEELLEVGDAFYLPPGYAPEAGAGTEIVQISAADELNRLLSTSSRLLCELRRN